MNKQAKEATGAVSGALAGGAAGAAAGTAIPGVGNAVGAVIGAVVGGAAGAVAGQQIARHIDPKVEDEYWRANHGTQPYASGSSYDEYQPAYRYGWESRGRHPVDRRFNDVERDLEQGWSSARGNSSLTWDRAKHASRQAWDRVERALPGDADRDGR
jgi:phage tail tape-measure protein